MLRQRSRFARAASPIRHAKQKWFLQGHLVVERVWNSDFLPSPLRHCWLKRHQGRSSVELLIFWGYLRHPGGLMTPDRLAWHSRRADGTNTQRGLSCSLQPCTVICSGRAEILDWISVQYHIAGCAHPSACTPCRPPASPPGSEFIRATSWDFLRLFFMCLTCPSTSKLGDLSPTTWFYWSTLGKLVYHLFLPTCGTLMEKNYPSTSLLTESHFMREIKLLSHPLLPIYLPVCLAQDVPNAGRASNSHQVAGREYRCSLLLPVQLK